MVDRPYHGYSISALRELSSNLALSQAQLADQRADCVKRAGSGDEDLCQLDVLISSLDDQLAAVDQELVTRHRESAADGGNARPGTAQRTGRVLRNSPPAMRANSKPHCRAKRAPAAVCPPN